MKYHLLFTTSFKMNFQGSSNRVTGKEGRGFGEYQNTCSSNIYTVMLMLYCSYTSAAWSYTYPTWCTPGGNKQNTVLESTNEGVPFMERRNTQDYTSSRKLRKVNGLIVSSS